MKSLTRYNEHSKDIYTEINVLIILRDFFYHGWRNKGFVNFSFFLFKQISLTLKNSRIFFDK